MAAPDALRRELLDAQQAWARALVDHELQALAGRLDEALVYIHSNGLHHDRDAYLRHVEAGPRFVSVQLHGLNVLASSPLAVIEGMIELTLLRAGQTQPQSLCSFLTQVWCLGPLGWRLRRAQTTRPATAVPH